MVRDLQGSRQALDEKLATSDIQLFGRPAGAAVPRLQNGHAEHAAGVQLAADHDDALTDDEEVDVDEDSGMNADLAQAIKYHSIGCCKSQPWRPSPKSPHQ